MRESTKKAIQSGTIYGGLMLTGKSFLNEKWERFVECICDCGQTAWKYFNNVKKGHTKSCGCLWLKTITKHGLSMEGHPIHTAWTNIKTRCHQEDGRDFPAYGGIGIIVCDEWRYNLDSFFKWSIENGWRKGLSLDRYPNNETGNYEPSNCRWATPAQQNRNKTNNIWVTAFGETKCLMDWSLDKRAVVQFNTIRYRLKILKWDAEKAITHPDMNKDRANRKNAIKIKYKGQVKLLSDWCKELALNYKTIRSRLYKGWSYASALETPKFKNKQ